MKVAVLGLGRMGRRHVQVVRDLGMQIVGLADAFADAQRVTREELGIEDTSLYHSNAVDALRVGRPEAVVVSTTAPSHCELVCAAAEAGARYILCEKPLATSLADADRMIEACQRAGALLGVNHQMRFMAQYTEIKAAIDTPEFGGLTGLVVSGSNFGLAMNGSHYFEMFRYITGAPVASVQAWLDAELVPNPRGPQFEDRAGRLRVVGVDGRSMYFDCSAGAGHGVQVIYQCRYGQLYVDELSGYLRSVRRQDEFRALPTTRYGMPGVEDIRRIPPADVLGPTRAVWESMLAGRDPPDGDAGRHAVACLCAALTSAQFGSAEVRLDDGRIDRNLRHPWA
jgi:predicted dehydrogenase